MAITAAAIILQNANPAQLEKLLTAVSEAEIPIRAIWKNSPVNAVIESLGSRYSASLLGTGENYGVARALNELCAWANQKRATQLVIFDQDSEITSSAFSKLQQEFACLKSTHNSRCAAIGPKLVDARTGKAMAQFAPYRLWRKPLGPDRQADHLITSCMLFDLRAHEIIGPFNENYFVDLIDIEWCLRGRSFGYTFHVSKLVEMRQRIGFATRNVFGRSVYVHRPERNFFQIRNALWLIRLGPIGWARKINEALHLALRIMHILLFGETRLLRFSNIISGLIAGLKTPRT